MQHATHEETQDKAVANGQAARPPLAGPPILGMAAAEFPVAPPAHQVNAAVDSEPEQQRQDDHIGKIERHVCQHGYTHSQAPRHGEGREY